MLKLNFLTPLFAASVLSAALFTGCGGDASDDDDDNTARPTPPPEDDDGGDDDTTGPGNDDDEPGPGVGPDNQTDCSYEPTSVESLPDPDNALLCSYFCVPNPKLTEFTSGDWGGSGSQDTSTSITWGDTTTLTGGTFGYGEVLTLASDTAAGTIRFTGTVTANGHAGWGMWFGPCSNATRFTGIRFVGGGSLGAAGQLEFQVQTNNNYPISEGATDKGTCPGTFASGCTNNKYVIDELFPSSPEPIDVSWENLIGGTPRSEMEPAELVGIQWQFNCGGTACDVDVMFEKIEFY